MAVKPLWLSLFFLAFLSLNPAKLTSISAAVSHLPQPQTLPDTPVAKQSSKIVILTTGTQIKLYPFFHGQLNHYYILKPAEFELNQADSIAQLGENSFARWTIERAQRRMKAKSSANKRKSILPLSLESSDTDDDYSGESGWKSPWIADVDYFFDPDYCQHLTQDSAAHLNECLVVVWLDINNNFIRYGSLNLHPNTIEPNRTHFRQKKKILYLHEFPPIDVYRDVIPDDSASSQQQRQIYAMTIDKQRSKLHVALSDGTKNYANLILTGVFKTHNRGSNFSQLHQEMFFSFNECPNGQASGLSSLDNSNLNNLIVDEDNGNWLFYHDQRASGKIYALNVFATRWSSALDWNTSQPFHAKQALVYEIPSGNTLEPKQLPTQISPVYDYDSDARSQESTDKLGGLERSNSGKVIGITIDSANRQLLWLNQANELYTCDYSGRDVRLIRRFSHGPVIRSLKTMQVFQHTLYVSDSIKSSFIAYDLSSQENLLAEMRSDKLQASELNHEIRRESMIIQPAHQVLLVEMPSLSGFRVFDLEKRITLLNDGALPSYRMVEQDLASLDDSDHSWLDSIESYLTRKGISEGSIERDEYDRLLERVSYEHHCGLDDPFNEELSASRESAWGLLLIMKFVVVQLVFWFFAVASLIKCMSKQNVKLTNFTDKCPV